MFRILFKYIFSCYCCNIGVTGNDTSNETLFYRVDKFNESFLSDSFSVTQSCSFLVRKHPVSIYCHFLLLLLLLTSFFRVTIYLSPYQNSLRYNFCENKRLSRRCFWCLNNLVSDSLLIYFFIYAVILYMLNLKTA